MSVCLSNDETDEFIGLSTAVLVTLWQCYA